MKVTYKNTKLRKKIPYRKLPYYRNISLFFRWN